MQVKFILRTLAIFVVSGFFSILLQAQADSTTASIATSDNGSIILLFIVLAIVLARFNLTFTFDTVMFNNSEVSATLSPVSSLSVNIIL